MAQCASLYSFPVAQVAEEEKAFAVGMPRPGAAEVAATSVEVAAQQPFLRDAAEEAERVEVAALSLSSQVEEAEATEAQKLSNGRPNFLILFC